jgi:hypothetical protein
VSDQIQLAVLRALRDGRPQTRMQLIIAVSRDLHQRIGDRAIRQAIEDLRVSPGPGCLIVSSARKRGYRLTRSYEDILDSYAEERRRALTLLRRLRIQRRNAEELLFQSQLELPI